MNRLVQTFAWSVVALALAPGVHAVEAKGGATKDPKQPTIVKQPRVSKSFAQTRTTVVTRQSRSVARMVPAKPSFGQIAGLHAAADDLDLKSSVALVIDQESGHVLLRKNESAVLPIASLTKLMTGMIISDAKLPMDESITISQDDVDTEKHTGSRLKVGVTLTRGELMHLSLMSSENRAANALGRTYPGGMSAFVEAMNTKAKLLGMKDTRYVEPTGLSSRNQSSAQDLAQLVMSASQDPLLSELSTSPRHEVTVGKRTLQFSNTNRLVKNSAWDITLQKTGYISEAGQCLVMQAKVSGRKLVMVFLDSAGKLSRIGDAERVRRWVETQMPAGLPMPTTGGNTLVRQVSG
ncbi:D-alanyl-D-alanine endopeptidase [Ramlibacter sp. PS3R-8]|uniref:D-alanyl-D-alanine endopeptidase n=1 Tax=Ramlibacter sp. PS3R-8 TaxID=3133437 RepID=UPI00309BE967